jgi:endonuclease/exonuclease/phosphatase (EEP) superfamily protein YafD
VYRDNRDYRRLLQLVQLCDPDIIFLVETDEAWEEGVRSLCDRYPHQLLKPLDNTYGLLLYSRLPLKDARINYHADPDVPSAETIVTLRSGADIRLWGLHPKPPVPGEDLRTTAKDKELLKVAESASNSDLPAIVMGDLNDVAWSYTTELFRKTSRLLDPRRGRGFYSTFNARNPFMRFPLDYIFCSGDFGLIMMKRLPRFGSDHFAMFTEVQYDPALKRKQDRPSADEDELREADKKKQARQ